jgi:CRP-like cAMP-binding protein/GNAT superfamily N-acetyltransferase
VICIREARDSDAAGIRDLFLAAYGDEYTYPDVYDEQRLKKLIFGEDVLLLVAEHEDGRLLGTASVILEIGAYTDLVGELGRLVVHPEVRGTGVGKLLMEARLSRVADRLHVGFVESRVVHPWSQRIAHQYGFAPVGFLPMKLHFGDRREGSAILVKYFGQALELRRNHPRIAPEVYRLAAAALTNVGLRPDLVVDEDEAPYPPEGGFSLAELTDEGYSSLLRIERGRTRKREIFGPLRLHYGFFKLRAESSNYLIAHKDSTTLAAVGFTYNEHEENLRVFELIHLDDRAIHFLFEQLVERWRERAVVIEVDVSAHAPRMQRTLLELGFVPAAYVPAFAFHRVERRDMVRMIRLLRPLDLGDMELVSPTRELAELVLRSFSRRDVAPRLAELAPHTDLFAHLSDEQRQRLAGACAYRRIAAGQPVFAEGEEATEMYLVLSGEARVEREGRGELGRVGGGECLGEVALLAETPHSAAATAASDLEVAVLTRDDLKHLVRQRPDVGVVLYRNLAVGLGDKLRRADGADG